MNHTTQPNGACTLCAELADDNHSGLIVETEHWRVVLSFRQAYVGRLFVMLREHKASLSDLTDAEWAEFNQLVPLLEGANRRAFGGTPFNWLSMMNDSYKNTPPNPHVHWHMLPRYNHDVVVAGQTFTDPEFGQHYDPPRQRLVSPEVRDAIIQKITAAMAQTTVA